MDGPEFPHIVITRIEIPKEGKTKSRGPKGQHQERWGPRLLVDYIETFTTTLNFMEQFYPVACCWPAARDQIREFLFPTLPPVEEQQQHMA